MAKPSSVRDTFSNVFTQDEDKFWQNLTEGEVVDIDLCTACAIGEYENVKTVIHNARKFAASVTVNKQNKGGWTPLLYVCFVGHDNIAELLIREGADVVFKDRDGRSPLTLACCAGNISLVQRLVENNAIINHEDKDGRTPLYHATTHGQAKVVKYLLSISADCLIRENKHGYTPFMEAALQGLEGIFNTFLEHGIDLNLVSHEGYRARDLARIHGKDVIVNMIDNHGRKFASLRYEAELSEKVQDWLSDQSPDNVYENILALSDPSSGELSRSIPVCYDFERDTAGESLGLSVGETIVDFDRTPVGTPVDSIFHKYMASDVDQNRDHDDLPTLREFLENLDLEKYEDLFEEESVDFRILLDLTEEDFKDLGIKLGPRRRIKLAVEDWKNKVKWKRDENVLSQEMNNLKLQLADVYSKLQLVTNELGREKEARMQLEAGQMEERARRNHMYFLAEKVKNVCQDLKKHTRNLGENLDTLQIIRTTPFKDVKEIQSKLKELHELMSEAIFNTDTICETIFRRMAKMTSDDVTELSSGSDSPESSCTSFSKSECSVASSTAG